MARRPPEFIRAKPDDENLYHFHYVIEGPPDTPYHGGFFHGELVFPPNYPLAPPRVVMHTPSGRFEVDMALCLSMSDYHPETWNPVWGVEKILMGLLSFMTGNGKDVWWRESDG